MSFLTKKTKAYLSDSVWSILALLLMNCVVQLVLYPILRNTLGTGKYGDALYAIGAVNIMATSFGSGANMSRLVKSVNGKTYNIDSVVWLAAAQVIAAPVCWLVLKAGGLPTDFGQVFLLWLLASATMWRYYADVEYRLSTNFKGYFVYYAIISVGYLFGILLFRLTGLWQMILLPGELSGLLFVLWKGSIFRNNGPFSGERFKPILRSIISLMFAQLLVNLVLNADRLLLQPIIGGEAVTIYYIASLVGKTMALISTPLNSVIIGHLAKSDKQMSMKSFLKLSGVGVVLIVLALLICVFGSHIFARLFYPAEYDVVKPLLWLANLAQIFYFATGVLTTVLLRYIKERYQVIINIAYVTVFAIVTITSAVLWGMIGFAVGILVTNAFRYFFTTVLGAVQLKKLEKQEN